MNSRSQHRINVEVETSYMEEQSSPDNNRYVFAYTITIHNTGEVPARLLNRHWLITDSNGKVQEVRGAGVVGEHPYLRPGEDYVYTSGAIIETPVGSMQGSYEMVTDEGVHFDAPIDRFSLSIPRTLH